MEDIAILLTQTRKEAEKIFNVSCDIFVKAAETLSKDIDYIEPAGMKKYKFKDSQIAFRFLRKKFNDFVAGRADDIPVQHLIIDLFRTRTGKEGAPGRFGVKGVPETSGLFLLLMFVAKAKELRDFCILMEGNPAAFTPVAYIKLEELVSNIDARYQNIPTGAISGSQSRTLGRLKTAVNTALIVSLKNALKGVVVAAKRGDTTKRVNV